MSEGDIRTLVGVARWKKEGMDDLSVVIGGRRTRPFSFFGYAFKLK
jgi:hypothetical protein